MIPTHLQRVTDWEIKHSPYYQSLEIKTHKDKIWSDCIMNPNYNLRTYNKDPFYETAYLETNLDSVEQRNSKTSD